MIEIGAETTGPKCNWLALNLTPVRAENPKVGSDPMGHHLLKNGQQKLSFILYQIPSSFSRFFVAQKKKIFQNLIFLSYSEKKWIFLPYRANFFLKMNFKNLKVVLEATEAVEATIMNTRTLKELGIHIQQKKVPSNIRNKKKVP